MKIAIALSGGIDSAVSAYLLKKEGYDLVAITFKLFDSHEENIERASQIANKLKISHYIIDLRKKFKKEIVDYFITSYEHGKTPNPCALCNRLIKFGEAFNYAIYQLRANKFATGHYIETEKYKDEILFKRGKDKNKDQSYFLALVKKEVIPYLIFPLGDWEKEEVKKLAKTFFSFLKTNESQDICFLKGKTLKEFLANYLSKKNGPIVYDNKIVGFHPGIYWFTVGQRKGLGIPLGKPLYVISLDPETNTIFLGEKEKLYSKGLILENLNLHLPLEKWEDPWAQIRYRTKPVKVKNIFKENSNYVVLFEEPVKSVTPGQVCAFYEKNYLLGGGIIKNKY
ncbi:tRNA 2-thiouridine(34) synthase MnmA [Thermodesulfobacterium hydrogeniphilum]|uniref:tRNA 2-thiouridine(34) synthase MnmA n=1 Tax=Thermodesulfobacterium hydrogeniphilum TaxID=161156 RepID=UPI000570655A|nr:tRNA 2-thiouridine(34) synthase MnmA [Thermodesulfobacterium hydrogeniphilum]